MGKTTTSTFGVSKREGHDSSAFYTRNLLVHLNEFSVKKIKKTTHEKIGIQENWQDKIYCQTSENMPVPDSSVALAFTSPPYNVGKEYDDDISLEDYFRLIQSVGEDVYRVLKPGGRYVINIANLGRKPYIPMHSFFYQVHTKIGFLPMGEIIWQKAEGANGSCAWGSWLSAKAPRIRDIHEYLMVFSKEDYSRGEDGFSDIERDEFMSSTLSIWKIPPESAKRVGHPAPFPVDLAKRVIRLYSYVNDVILDPFVGAGATCVAAKELKRHYIGFDINKKYCEISENRLAKVG